MLKRNNFSIIIFLIIIVCSYIIPADKDVAFGDILLHHVTNDQNQVYMPIEIGGIDLSITKHVILIWGVAALVVILSILGTSRYRKGKNALPSKFTGLFEILIEFIRKNIVNPNIGEKYSNRWTPLIATYFIFILIANFLGLIPILVFIPGGSSTITGNFAVTGALAIITFIAIIIAGTKKHGFIGHWKNMIPIPKGVPAPVLLILIPVELLGIFIKPLTLMLRLGANMTAGHIGMVAIFGLPIILVSRGFSEGIGFSIGFISILINTAIFFLEMIICMVQAYVFALLSAVFIGMAIHGEH